MYLTLSGIVSWSRNTFIIKLVDKMLYCRKHKFMMLANICGAHNSLDNYPNSGLLVIVNCVLQATVISRPVTLMDS